MRPNYSHTYESCAHSLKRKDAPWRVVSGCGNRLRLSIGKLHELPTRTICLTCPFYRKGDG